MALDKKSVKLVTKLISKLDYEEMTTSNFNKIKSTFYDNNIKIDKELIDFLIECDVSSIQLLDFIYQIDSAGKHFDFEFITKEQRRLYLCAILEKCLENYNKNRYARVFEMKLSLIIKYYIDNELLDHRSFVEGNEKSLANLINECCEKYFTDEDALELPDLIYDLIFKHIISCFIDEEVYNHEKLLLTISEDKEKVGIKYNSPLLFSRPYRGINKETYLEFIKSALSMINPNYVIDGETFVYHIIKNEIFKDDKDFVCELVELAIQNGFKLELSDVDSEEQILSLLDLITKKDLVTSKLLSIFIDNNYDFSKNKLNLIDGMDKIALKISREESFKKVYCVDKLNQIINALIYQFKGTDYKLEDNFVNTLSSMAEDICSIILKIDNFYNDWFMTYFTFKLKEIIIHNRENNIYDDKVITSTDFFDALKSMLLESVEKSSSGIEELKQKTLEYKND